MAVATCLNNAKTLFLLKKPFSLLSRASRPYHRKTPGKASDEDEQRRKEEGAGCWMPHPRTGIYFPRGHESVMDAIPSDAALFDCTFWLRSIDGVEEVDCLKSNNHNSSSSTKLY